MVETDTVAREIEELRRLRKAYEAALLIATEVDTEQVLQRIVDLAVEVVPAKYAALGVADERGKIVLFITHGITPEERAAIGPLPQGHGLLGELIREKKPLIVHDMAKDPRSIGFPPNHPPMRSLLGVPILLGERALGNLYLTEPLARDQFTEDDLRALEVLAAHAASAIDRSHLYNEARQARERAIAELNRTQAILNNLPSAVFIIDTQNYAVRRANTTALQMIYGSADATADPPQLGHDCTILSGEGTPLELSKQPHVRAAHGEVVTGQQVILDCPGRRPTYMLAHAAKLPPTSGEPEQVILVLQNINRLRESEQLKDDFLSLISHELRTPLTAITRLSRTCSTKA
jgi:K+-sensing histidine kinase KdpD